MTASRSTRLTSGLTSFSQTSVRRLRLELGDADHPTLPRSCVWACHRAGTRGFDPTLRVDGHQIPNAVGINNEKLNLVFGGEHGAEIQELPREVFIPGLPMEPKVQGIWNNKWAGTREEDVSQTLRERYKIALLKNPKSNPLRLGLSAHRPEHPYKCKTDLNERTEWITTQYFDPKGELNPGAWAEVSQDMSLRHLGKWDVQTDGFTDEMFSQFYMASIGQSFVNGVDEEIDADADGATFVADNDWCSVADVMAGQGKYGGKVYFDAQGNVMHIVYDNKKYQSEDHEWMYVKAKCRSTVLMLLTGMEVTACVLLARPLLTPNPNPKPGPAPKP